MKLIFLANKTNEALLTKVKRLMEKRKPTEMHEGTNHDLIF